MNTRLKRLTALLSAMSIFFSSVSIAAAGGQSDTKITNVNISADNKIQSAEVTVNAEGKYKIYAAVYENNILKSLDIADVTESGRIMFGNNIAFDKKSQILKCFIWTESMKPVSEIYIYEGALETDKPEETAIPVVANVPESTQTPIPTDTPQNTATPEPTNVPESTQTPIPTDTPQNTATPEPTNVPESTQTPIPTDMPQNTATPEPTNVPDGDGIIHLSDSGIKADGVENAIVSGSTVTLTAAGEYTIEGTLSEGQIQVNSTSADDEIIINLNNANVTNTTDDAFKGSKGKITLVPAADTENTFSASADSACGIYSKNDLTIKGEGKITANSTLGNGIRCKDDLEIGICDLVVNAGNNGIKGDDSVKITKKNKSVTVVSGGDGIKSDKEPKLDETSNTVEGGTVTINGGTINITANTVTESDGTTSNGDGIQADMLLEIKGGTITINAAGEAIKANASSVAYLEDSSLTSSTPAEGDGSVVISGGTIKASAGEDAIKAVKNVTISGNADITVTKSQEGIQVNEIIYGTDGTTVLGQVEGKIEINGGSLDITSSEDGIQCGTGDVVVTDGNITVNSVMDCIQSENIMNISGGVFNLTANKGANGSSTTNSCKGIKAKNLVYISGGKFDINTYDDAIHSNNTVRIKGGNITAATADDGVHGDSYLYISNNANINITKSYEGIEAAKIYIQGGETRIVSSDDGANAAGEEPTAEALDIDSFSAASVDMFAGPGWGGPDWGSDDSSSYGYIEISGGLLYIEAEGDGFDSNGSALISGGTLMVNGPTSGGNGVFDIGDGSNCTLTVTGGTIIGAGTSDMAVTPTSSTNSQYYVVTAGGSSGGRPGQPGSSTSGSFSSQSAGKAFQLMDSSGNEIATYVPSKSYSWVFVSTPDMASGTYTLNYGGSVSGGTYMGKTSYGLVTGGTYSGTSSITLTATK